MKHRRPEEEGIFIENVEQIQHIKWKVEIYFILKINAARNINY